LFLLFALQACGLFRSAPEEPLVVRETAVIGSVPSIPLVQSSSVIGTSRREREAPLELKVAQAFFDEEDLVVKVHLTAKTAMRADEIVVGVVGLEEGNVVEEKLQFVNEVVSQEILAPQSVTALRFTLTAKNLSEYQIRCSWGDEVQKVKAAAADLAAIEEQLRNSSRASLSKNPAQVDTREPPHPPVMMPPRIVRPAMPERPLSLEQVEIQEDRGDCREEPCESYFTIHATIKNHTNGLIQGVRLAVGIYWAKTGRLPQLPAVDASLRPSEELVTLDTLELDSEQSKRVRIKVDRKIPRVPGGSFIPHVRLLLQ
jgi:hypothetical protein